MGEAKRRGSREERIQQAVRLKDEGIETDYWRRKREFQTARAEKAQQKEAIKKMMENLQVGIKPRRGRRGDPVITYTGRSPGKSVTTLLKESEDGL